MLKSQKKLLLLALSSAIAAGICLWWWLHLVVGPDNLCIAQPAADVCGRHPIQMYGFLAFGSTALLLLISACLRWYKGSKVAGSDA